MDVARVSEWQREEQAGAWVAVEREFRDGLTETWWALEVNHGPYGIDKAKRAMVVTSEPWTLPEASTWYLISNLPAPGSEPATSSKLQAATLATGTPRNSTASTSGCSVRRRCTTWSSCEKVLGNV